MPKETAPILICALCERRVSRVSRHHLVPKSEGGTETVDLCSPCHATLHKFFTNRTLARQKYTIAALQQDPDIQRYLAWIRKQPDRRITVKRKRDRF
ncbi:MAG: HNH endonuclease [Chloroflexi bacterium CFX4]|nr:HNH endonuclease [Chloroflexi bacterium CFX4]MDL1924402.1 HNH endonuclease [Chloroflexi bacterium CFX3]